MRIVSDIYHATVGIVVWYATLIFVSVLFYPVALFAQVIPPVPSAELFIEALNNRHWPLAVALGVTIVVWFIRYVISDKIPSHIIPYVMLACTVLSSVSCRIIQAVSDNHTWWTAAIQGLLEGATIGFGSMGIWSAGGKAILPNVPKKE